jgi:hypothetical protein
LVDHRLWMVGDWAADVRSGMYPVSAAHVACDAVESRKAMYSHDAAWAAADDFFEILAQQLLHGAERRRGVYGHRVLARSHPQQVVVGVGAVGRVGGRRPGPHQLVEVGEDLGAGLVGEHGPGRPR